MNNVLYIILTGVERKGTPMIAADGLVKGLHTARDEVCIGKERQTFQ